MTLWAGTYASKGGRGLYPISPSPEGGWSVGEPAEVAANASFGTWSPKHRLHYLVDEQAGTLGAYRHDSGWRRLAAVPTGGSQPCHVALSPDEKQIAVANYGDGSLALFSLDTVTGQPSPSPAIHSNAGRGPHPDRQQGPHAHCVTFDGDGQWLYQVDLGTDRILVFSTRSGLRDPCVAFRAPPSSGPRHLIFRPGEQCCFLVSELASTVQLLQRENEILRSIQSLSTLPVGEKEESLGGHIGMNAGGDRLYVTNRGHDSVATFAFDGEKLSLRQHRISGGASPRFFLLIEGQEMIVLANEEGGNVTAFALEDDGTLGRQIFDLPVPGAAFLFWDMAS